MPRWGVFEAAFESAGSYGNPLQQADLLVSFTSPSKEIHVVPGFWDGGRTWRVRFSPGESGEWSYVTAATPSQDSGLHGRRGTFRVTPVESSTALERHGPIRVASGGRHLEHADGTPFFWLADTGWNAALLSTPEEWQHYLEVRKRQRFTAIQWVATQWRAAPTGDRMGEPAFTGHEQIAVNPAFFARLDEKAAALNRAGLLNVPVLLWAIGGGANPAVNPGFALPEAQAARLARYMVARWQAYDVVWILPGDGDYRGDKAERWKRIGRQVFGGIAHAPVIVHPGGMHWVLREFLGEPWVAIHGYQSGHGDGEQVLRWMTEGPPATDWTVEPVRPFINLEPPYENHIAYQSKQPISPHTVRRAVYWSLLTTPTAGVTYGGHGVWGWDDGTGPPTDHKNSGTPLPWKQALTMPGAEQMAYVAETFTSFDFWRLRPAPHILAAQPGTGTAARFIAAAASEAGDLAVVYTPGAQPIALDPGAVPKGRATWHNPATGGRSSATPASTESGLRFDPPGDGDWVLVIEK